MTCLHRLQFLTLVWKLLLDKFALDYVFADLLGGQRLSAADHAVKTQLIWQQIRTYGQFNPVNCGICSLLFSCVNVGWASQYYFLCCIHENSKDMHALVLWGLQTDRSVHIKRNLCSTSATLRRRHDNDNLFLHVFVYIHNPLSGDPSSRLPRVSAVCRSPVLSTFLAEIRIVSGSCFITHLPFSWPVAFTEQSVSTCLSPPGCPSFLFNALLCCHHGNGWFRDEPMQAHVWLSTQRLLTSLCKFVFRPCRQGASTLYTKLT